MAGGPVSPSGRTLQGEPLSFIRKRGEATLKLPLFPGTILQPRSYQQVPFKVRTTPAKELTPHRFGVSRGVEPLWNGGTRGCPPWYLRPERNSHVHLVLLAQGCIIVVNKLALLSLSEGHHGDIYHHSTGDSNPLFNLEPALAGEKVA